MERWRGKWQIIVNTVAVCWKREVAFVGDVEGLCKPSIPSRADGKIRTERNKGLGRLSRNGKILRWGKDREWESFKSSLLGHLWRKG